ncbi:MAG: MotA/TolQ/ExbB proton channel family protein [Candidatus Omnitrophica bacterium]|nr:MotA/TolQ/ExbB proton channel family protein [Candidatus Omnitrophota bacterium]
MNFFQLIISGGPILIPIILCSVITLTIFIERLMYFNSIRADVQLLKDRVFDLISLNKLKEAYAICEGSSSPSAKIIKAGLIKFSASRIEIKESMKNAGDLLIPEFKINLIFLSSITYISPLLGLLGTATGMAVIFRTIEVKTKALQPFTTGDLAFGVWSAILTTVAGMLVGILAFIAYNYCEYRITQFINEMDRSAVELMEKHNV